MGEARLASRDVAIRRVDVPDEPHIVERLREREARLAPRVAMVLAEQTPAQAAAAQLRRAELEADGAIVEALIPPEQQRRHRAAERERRAPVVRGLQPPVGAELQLTPPVAAREEELRVRLEVGEPQPRYQLGVDRKSDG